MDKWTVLDKYPTEDGLYSMVVFNGKDTVTIPKCLPKPANDYTKKIADHDFVYIDCDRYTEDALYNANVKQALGLEP